MPEAILKYTLPEEKSEFEAAMNGAKYKSALWELDQKLRAIVKYGCTEETPQELAEHIRDEISDMVGDLYE